MAILIWSLFCDCEIMSSLKEFLLIQLYDSSLWKFPDLGLRSICMLFFDWIKFEVDEAGTVSKFKPLDIKWSTANISHDNLFSLMYLKYWAFIYPKELLFFLKINKSVFVGFFSFQRNSIQFKGVKTNSFIDELQLF